jgi:hypothetical protein
MNLDRSDLGASRYGRRQTGRSRGRLASGCRFMFDVSAGVTDVDAHDERTDR